jgi:hypothetical protein
MSYLYLIAGAVLILLSIAYSAVGELKVLKPIVQESSVQASLIIAIRASWHLVSILLFGYGNILLRMGLPNMQVLCVQRQLGLIFSLVLIYGFWSWRKIKS